MAEQVATKYVWKVFLKYALISVLAIGAIAGIVVAIVYATKSDKTPSSAVAFTPGAFPAAVKNGPTVTLVATNQLIKAGTVDVIATFSDPIGSIGTFTVVDDSGVPIAGTSATAVDFKAGSLLVRFKCVCVGNGPWVLKAPVGSVSDLLGTKNSKPAYAGLGYDVAHYLNNRTATSIKSASGGASENAGYTVETNTDGTVFAIAFPNKTAGGFASAGIVQVFQRTGTTLSQLGADIAGTSASEKIGEAISLSSDGKTIAISTIAVNGLVRVYTLTNNIWTLKGTQLTGTVAGDKFGYSLSLSANGNSLVVGVPGSSTNSGSVLLYTYSSSAWATTGNTMVGAAGENFGHSVRLSHDGTKLAVSSPSLSTINSSVNVRTFTISTNGMTELSAAKLTVADAYAVVASVDTTKLCQLSLSSDGKYLVLSPRSTDSVKTYSWNGTTWSNIANINQTNSKNILSVSISHDGSRLLIGAKTDKPRLFQLLEGAWYEFVKSTLTSQNASSTALSGNGSYVIVGDYEDTSSAGKYTVYSISQ